MSDKILMARVGMRDGGGWGRNEEVRGSGGRGREITSKDVTNI